MCKGDEYGKCERSGMNGPALGAWLHRAVTLRGGEGGHSCYLQFHHGPFDHMVTHDPFDHMVKHDPFDHMVKHDPFDQMVARRYL